MKKAIRPNNPRLKSNREMKDQFTLLNSLRDMRLNQDDSKPDLDLRKADVKLPEISKAMVDQVDRRKDETVALRRVMVKSAERAYRYHMFRKRHGITYEAYKESVRTAAQKYGESENGQQEELKSPEPLDQTIQKSTKKLSPAKELR